MCFVKSKCLQTQLVNGRMIWSVLLAFLFVKDALLGRLLVLIKTGIYFLVKPHTTNVEYASALICHWSVT